MTVGLWGFCIAESNSVLSAHKLTEPVKAVNG